MSKLAEALRAHNIYNDHGLLSQFGVAGKTDVAVDYRPSETRTCRASGTQVFSPSHKTNPDSAWYDYGKKTFVGKRKESMPKAIAWATETYGIDKWAPSPFGGTIPASVLAAAKQFVRDAF